MKHMFERCSEQQRAKALSELGTELGEFSYDGLVQLAADLAVGKVVRGSWSGCVMSYKRGSPGSARRDRCGRARNAFTVLWDMGWLTDEEVVALVEAELGRRGPGDGEGAVVRRRFRRVASVDQTFATG